MSTSEFDYAEHTRTQEPNWPEVTRGTGAREARRRRAVKTKVTIRLDAEVVEGFKALVPEGEGYQGLINRALRDWLEAQSVAGLLERNLPRLIQDAVKTHLP